MNAFRQTCAAALFAAGSLVALPSAFAAGPNGTSSSYQSERASCGHNQQDTAACIREAGAAAQASRNGTLTHASNETYRQNALARCQLQPDTERQACAQRVLGTGATTIDGSVMGGGAIRETVTPVTPVAQAPMVPPPAYPAYRQPMPPAEPMAPATMPPATVHPAPAPAPIYPASPAPAYPPVTN